MRLGNTTLCIYTVTFHRGLHRVSKHSAPQVGTSAACAAAKLDLGCEIAIVCMRLQDELGQAQPLQQEQLALAEVGHLRQN
eukprot:scaffold90_cov264-Pinguiococcus_pyrenoidosus.AAC.16